MNTTLSVRGKMVTIQLAQHIVRITNDNGLTTLLSADTKAATYELVTAIKKVYYQQFNTSFHVSDASIAIEIWGHVYVEKMAMWLQSLTSIKVMQKITKKLIYHCELIDIGERKHDGNRFVWDWLTAFTPVIERLLPK